MKLFIVMLIDEGQLDNIGRMKCTGSARLKFNSDIVFFLLVCIYIEKLPPCLLSDYMLLFFTGSENSCIT